MADNDLSYAQQLIKDCINSRTTVLDLGRCGIEDLNDLPQLFECHWLETLNLGCWYWHDGRLHESNNQGETNQIRLIPSAFNRLEQLKNLSLNVNQISDLSPLAALTGLQQLDLRDNQIRDLSPLAALTGLQELFLRDNQISDLSPLAALTGLQELDLRSNQITHIDPVVFNLALTIHTDLSIENGLHLCDNPISSPPLEILNQGREAVLDWLAAQKIELNEIKIILIGDAKAGKTSLLKRLKQDQFDAREVQTDGVNIEDIEFAEHPGFAAQTALHGLTGHFWDFGGQEIMNATHQFFLTKRALYILLLDARKDANVAGQIRHWINRIRATGGDSPIVVVANQVDINAGFGFASEYELRQEFPQIKAFIKASCKTGKNLDELKNTLAEWIPQAELFHTEIDQRWMQIKQQLQAATKTEYYLNKQRFIDICYENNLTEPRQQKNAIHFLHDLGLVLHFDELRLEDYFVLDPYWITYGVYQILTSSYAGNRLGEVPHRQLDFIINQEEDKTAVYRPSEYKKIAYDHHQRVFLLDILQAFKLCFTLKQGSEERFIIPDLLDTHEPSELSLPIRKDNDCISLIYHYNYLPSSILPNVMVEVHQDIVQRWRTGFIAQLHGCQVLVTVYDQKLSIRVQSQSNHRREAMAIMRNEIERVNKTLSEQPRLLVPLPGTSEFADYDELLGREAQGEKEYSVFKARKLLGKFTISELLEGIKNDTQLDRIEKELVDLKADLKAGVDGLTVAIDAIEYRQIRQSEAIMADINSTLEEWSGSFNQQQQQLYLRLQEAPDDFKVKLKLALPVIAGLQLETEFDVKSWAQRMYKKYQLQAFELMCDVGKLG